MRGFLCLALCFLSLVANAVPAGYVGRVGTMGPSSGNRGVSIDLSSNLDNRITFTRASSASYYNASGVLSWASTDIPRFSYDPSTHVARGLFIEGGRTNIVLNSENLGSWNAPGSGSFTLNSATAPDGTATMDKLSADSASAAHFATQSSITFVSGTTYTFSTYLKPAEQTWAQLTMGFSAFTGSIYANFDISNGVIGNSSGVSATIQNIGGGIYRAAITSVANANISTTGPVICLTSSTDPASRLPTTQSVSGTGIYIWGSQIEAGEFASSYISTTAAAATRAVDIANITNLASIRYNATQGTALATFMLEGVNNPSVTGMREFQFWGGSSSNRFGVVSLAGAGVAGNIVAAMTTSGSAQWGATGQTLQALPSTFATYKTGFAYQQNNLGAVINGGAVSTNTSASIPTVSSLAIGNNGYDANNPLFGWFKSLTYYPTRLPDNKLQSLTQ